MYTIIKFAFIKLVFMKYESILVYYVLDIYFRPYMDLYNIQTKMFFSSWNKPFWLVHIIILH
jgi:hypothetical protein